MKTKGNPSFSVFPAVEGKREEAPSVEKSETKAPSQKTSLDPLYDTTDKYRQVVKPMKVEDFLKPK